MAKANDLISEWPHDPFARNRGWQRFLTPLVGKSGSIPVALLDDALKKLTEREGDARGEIYAYLDARQTVGASRAFWIAEALRECGVGWSSGVIALAIADHLKEFVALLALLSSGGRREATIAATLAACSAVVTCIDRAIIDAWTALAKKRGSYGGLFQLVPLPLRDAYASAHLEDGVSRRHRVFEDLGRWAILIAHDTPEMFPMIEQCFACRSRLYRNLISLRDKASKDIIYPLDEAEKVGFDDVLESRDLLQVQDQIDTYLRKRIVSARLRASRKVRSPKKVTGER